MSRKLQSEIERVLKKIGEGVQEFNNILEKVRNANTNNQKEKYESDLKKEIKKLQRQRDQLKNWIADKDVKDKKPLLEARRVIEEHMETFRDCERKTKTKAYSKEGLQMAEEDEDEKSEMRDWLNDTVASLTDQMNHLEAELDKPDIDMEKMVTYDHLRERYAFHVSALGIILDQYERNDVGDDAMVQIKEALDEYVRESQDPDYYENEELYEDLGIELPRHLYENPGQLITSTSKNDAKEKEEAAAAAAAAAAASAAAAAAAAQKEAAKRQAAAEKERKEKEKERRREEAREAEARAQAAREAAKNSQKDRSKVASTPPGVSTAPRSPAPAAVQGAPTWAARAAGTTAEDSEKATLGVLENSMQHMPKPLESDRPKQYTAKNPYPMPSYYPSAPLPFDSQAVFEKFDTDTLFFIFYYQQGTYQQYLAAAELKSRSWRYHKKYLTWFQRHEEPKEITQEFEQGTYVYFDYETGWCQRKKTEFTFAYRYLEDN